MRLEQRAPCDIQQCAGCAVSTTHRQGNPRLDVAHEPPFGDGVASLLRRACAKGALQRPGVAVGVAKLT